jgi:hypothetical protein
MDKDYNIWITVVSIKFDILSMLNNSPAKTVFFIEPNGVHPLNHLTFS